MANMEFISQEIIPPTFASAAGLVVVETTDTSVVSGLSSSSSHASNVAPKTLILAAFRGTSCAVYEVNAGATAASASGTTTTTTTTTTNNTTSSSSLGVKQLLFEDWVGCKVTHAASTCDGSLTCLTDDLSIVILTFDLIRKRVLKRFQSLLPNDESAKVQRRSFTPSLVVSNSSGGQFVLCHAYEGYIHEICTRLILASTLTSAFDGAIKRHQLAKQSPYSLSFTANDARQYIALHGTTAASSNGGIPRPSSSSANKTGSDRFYTTVIARDKVTFITQTTLGQGASATTTAVGSARSHRVKGVPFLVSALTRTNATVVVTDETIALMVPEGGFSPAVVPYDHGIPNLLDDRVAVTAVFDATSPTVSSAIPTVIVSLSDGRYYRVLLTNDNDDCDSFCRRVDPFTVWRAANNDTNEENVEASPSTPTSPTATNNNNDTTTTTTPLVAWNYGSMVRGVVAGVSPTNGDVYLMKPSEGIVLPNSVSTCHTRLAGMMMEGNSNNTSAGPSTAATQATRLLRGVVTGVVPYSSELITSTSDGWVRRSQVVLDTDVVAEISAVDENVSTEASKVTYHTVPTAAAVSAASSSTTATTDINSLVVMSTPCGKSQFLWRTSNIVTGEEAIEVLAAGGGSSGASSSSSSFVVDEPTLAFGFSTTSASTATSSSSSSYPVGAIQVTQSGIYWYTVHVPTTNSSLPTIERSSASKAACIRKASICDGAVAVVEMKKTTNAADVYCLKMFARKTSEVTELPLCTGDVSSMCVMPSADEENNGNEDDDVRVVMAFWGSSTKLSVVSSAAKAFIGTITADYNGGSGGGVQSDRYVVADMGPLNAHWVILQLSNGSLFGQKVNVCGGAAAEASSSSSSQWSSLSTTTTPVSGKAGPCNGYIPGTMAVNRSLSTIAVAAANAIYMIGVRTCGGGSADAPTSSSSSALTAASLNIVSERRYGIPTKFSNNNANKNNKSIATGVTAPTLTSISFFGAGAELMKRARLFIANGATPATIIDLRTSYSHQIVDEKRLGASVLHLVGCDVPSTHSSVAAALAERNRKKKQMEAAATAGVANSNNNKSGLNDDSAINNDNAATIAKKIEESIADGSYATAAAQQQQQHSVPTATEPSGIIAVVEHNAADPAQPPSFGVALLHIRHNKVSPADEKLLPMCFVPSCCKNSAMAPFKTAASPFGGGRKKPAAGAEEEKTTTSDDNTPTATESSTDEKQKKGSSTSSGSSITASAVTQSHIVVGGCDLTNGTGKLITYSTSGATFTTSSQTSVNAPVNDITFTVADNELALAVATHFELLLYKFSGSSNASSSGQSTTTPATALLVSLCSLRIDSPILTLASSLTVVAAASSGLITYYEYAGGALRERAAEILPLSTITAMAGVDGHFVKCDANRNMFIHSIQEKSKKVAKLDPHNDKYSMPMKACLRLQSWASKIIVSENSLSPIVDSVRLHMGLNTAYDPLFVICGISKKYYICGSDGSLSMMVRVPHDLFRFLIRVEHCLETYLDHERRDYLLSYVEKQLAAEEAAEDNQTNNSQKKQRTIDDIDMRFLHAQHSQATWTIRDAKQCVSECRTLRAANILNLKTMNDAYFTHLTPHEQLVLVKEHLQSDSSDLITPFTLASVLQRCVALL